MGSHSITCYVTKMNVPCLNANLQYLICLPSRDGSLSQPRCWFYTEMVTCLQTVTHPYSNHLLMTGLRVKLTTSWW